MVKLIIFDLDGTLIDAYDAVSVALKKIFKQLNLPDIDDDIIKRSVGWGERHLLGCFIPKDKLDYAVALYREYHKEALPDNVKFLPDAEKMLKKAKSLGCSLAIATNRPFWSTDIILDCLNIKNRFSFVLSADQIKAHKPEPEIIETIIKKLQFSKKDILYVGDMTIDAQTGNAAGVKIVIVTTGSSTKEEILKEKPFRVIDNIYDLINIVSELNSCIV